MEEKVSKLIEEINKTHRYSIIKIYEAFNEVFGTRDVPQSCASCLIRKKQYLERWLKDKDYIPPYLKHIDKI